MRLVDKEVLEMIDGTALEMANYFSRDTGLRKTIWIDQAAPNRSIPHDKRRVKYGPSQDISIKFNEKGDCTVEGSFKKSDFPDVARVQEWIKLNLAALTKLYDGYDNKGNRYTIDDFDSEKKLVK